MIFLQGGKCLLWKMCTGRNHRVLKVRLGVQAAESCVVSLGKSFWPQAAVTQPRTYHFQARPLCRQLDQTLEDSYHVLSQRRFDTKKHVRGLSWKIMRSWIVYLLDVVADVLTALGSWCLFQPKL